MKIADFRKIDTYFIAKGKTVRLAHLAYSSYIDNVESAIKTQNLIGLPLSDPKIEAVCQNYLTDAQLDSLIIVTEKREETSAEKKTGFKSFWIDVLSSFVSSALFAILIFVVYISLAGPTDPVSLKKDLDNKKDNVGVNSG